MKILLYGEFSGVHTNLRNGHLKNGHNVELWSEGDGHKKINGDVSLGNNFKNKYIRNLLRFFEQWLLLFKIRKYDVVQLISLEMLTMPDFLKVLYLKILKKQNRAIILNRCGLDTYGSCVILGKLEYSPVLNEIKEEKYETFCKEMSLKKLRYAIKLSKLFTGIIVNTYEYHLPYVNFKNYLGHIPLPMTIEDSPKPNIVSDSIIILYGILRKERKGHRFINAALDIIKNKYKEKVEIIQVEKLSLYEYDLLLNKCNILIDQACSYSIGMNALYALSKGKVVLGGNEKEAEIFEGAIIPVINILPSIQDIVQKLSDLIDCPLKITEIGELSRKYSIEFHQEAVVANKYIELINRHTTNDK